MNAEFQKEGGTAFYPQFFFKDLPVTPRGLAIRCKEVAEEEGLRRVRIGNLHLL
jgi:pyruvate-formate lyase-activating enzyme